jgi:cell division protein FtsB
MLLRAAMIVLGAMLLALQYRIWFGPHDAFDALALRGEIAEQRIENERLLERNRALAAEVRDLKQGGDAVEERARSDLGMVKDSETFYRVVSPVAGTPSTAPAPVGAPTAPSAPGATTAADHKPARKP